MTAPVIILGAGGHARVVADALVRSGRTILGCTVPDVEPGRPMHGIGPVVGDDAAVLSKPHPGVVLVNGVGSVERPIGHQELYDRFKAAGFTFADVIDPWAHVASRVTVSEGAQILAGAIVQPDCQIGCNAIVNTGARIDHDCDIGNHVHLAPGSVLSGNVTIGDGSHVGTASCIVQGVTVGAGCLIGAGAVVLRDVPAGATIIGVPARPLWSG